ncbi:MAG: hypothetical protein HA496_00130 [Thaumarchaeota archaeon]|nr:hypothetical protein [Nitrososphaerota archaeon]
MSGKLPQYACSRNLLTILIMLMLSATGGFARVKHAISALWFASPRGSELCRVILTVLLKPLTIYTGRMRFEACP